MTPERKFYPRGFQHIYQISADKSLLFCTIADMILLFTLICTYARKYNIRITQLCIMFNHFHIQISAERLEDLESFISAVNWAYALIYNKHYGIKGQVFRHSYGSAPKWQPAGISGNWIYIANNPVGKKAVQDAWDYRWNFLRYCPDHPQSKHPFSEEYNPLDASKEMLYLVKTVKNRAKEGKYISYDFFDSDKYTCLIEKERKQLLDIIISEYNVIDYEPLLMKYGSINQFCRVLKEITGNEYDIDDDWEPEDYRHYTRMIAIAAEEGYDLRKERLKWSGNFPYQQADIGKKAVRKNLKADNALMSDEMAYRLIRRFRNEVRATDVELRKFMRVG